MTNKEQKTIAQTMDDILTTVLGGPSGDPDDCHLSAAESCYDLIDQLDLHAAMRDVTSDYDSNRSQFFDRNSEFFPEYTSGEEDEEDDD